MVLPEQCISIYMSVHMYTCNSNLPAIHCVVDNTISPMGTYFPLSMYVSVQTTHLFISLKYKSASAFVVSVRQMSPLYVCHACMSLHYITMSKVQSSSCRPVLLQ